MVRNILLVSFLTLSSFLFSQQMELSSEVVDYGNVKMGEKAVSEITVKNIGKTPLIITKVKPTCGCTIPSWPKKPIMPGKSEKIGIEYDTSKKGAINKIVEVFSNDKNASRKIIKIKGKIY